jgi:hypothetical protein
MGYKSCVFGISICEDHTPPAAVLQLIMKDGARLETVEGKTISVSKDTFLEVVNAPYGTELPEGWDHSRIHVNAFSDVQSTDFTFVQDACNDIDTVERYTVIDWICDHTFLYKGDITMHIGTGCGLYLKAAEVIYGFEKLDATFVTFIDAWKTQLVNDGRLDATCTIGMFVIT